MNLLKRTAALVVVTLVLGTAGCTKSSSDAAITSRVKTAISSDPGLKGTTVGVSTDANVVHLKGTVKSRAERAMLIAAARKVEGVKAVKADVVVEPQRKTAVEARGKRKLRAEQRVTPRVAEPPGYER